MEPPKGGSILFMKIEKLKMAVVPALMLLAVLLFGAILYMEKPNLAPIPEREQVIAEGGGGGSFMPQSSTNLVYRHQRTRITASLKCFGLVLAV